MLHAINKILDENALVNVSQNAFVNFKTKEIGLADKLGSGIRNLVKYGKIYSDITPKLVEEDILSSLIFSPLGRRGH